MPAKKVLLVAAAWAAMVASLALAPRAARAVRRYQTQQRKAFLAAAMDAVKRGADAVHWPKEAGESGARHDDPALRRLAELVHWGVRGPEFQARRTRIAAQETMRQAAGRLRTRQT